MGFRQFTFETNIGYTEGILVACKDEELEVTLDSKYEQYVHAQVKDKQGN